MVNEGEQPTQDSEAIFRSLVEAGRKKRERQTEELTQSFVQGGMWLARQRDPVQQFEFIAGKAIIIKEVNRLKAQQQFVQMVNPVIRNEEAVQAFEMLVGIEIFKIDPEKFLSTIMRVKSLLIPEKSDGKAKSDLKSLINNEEKIHTDKKDDFLFKRDQKSLIIDKDKGGGIPNKTDLKSLINNEEKIHTDKKDDFLFKQNLKPLIIDKDKGGGILNKTDFKSLINDGERRDNFLKNMFGETYKNITFKALEKYLKNKGNDQKKNWGSKNLDSPPDNKPTNE